MKVLIVDDEADITDSVVTWLEMEGHEAKGVQDTGAIQDVVRDFGPDVILQDVNMPGMDLTICIQQEREAAPDARILLFTGDVHTSELAESAGADGFVEKTADLDAMVRKISA